MRGRRALRRGEGGRRWLDGAAHPIMAAEAEGRRRGRAIEHKTRAEEMGVCWRRCIKACLDRSSSIS